MVKTISYDPTKRRLRGEEMLKIDQELKVEIEAIGRKGDGITKINGHTIFIQGGEVEIGKTYNIKIIKICPKFSFADLIGVI